MSGNLFAMTNIHFVCIFFLTSYSHKRRDTVELWRLPHQRKISLRFLAYYLLKMEIQDDLHDSIEDSWTALLLFRHYQAVKAKGYKHFHGEFEIVLVR
jgi:hypothetical protein